MEIRGSQCPCVGQGTLNVLYLGTTEVALPGKRVFASLTGNSHLRAHPFARRVLSSTGELMGEVRSA